MFAIFFKTRDMSIVWILLFYLISSFKTDAFNVTTRIAEWDSEYRYGDPVKRLLKFYSRGGNVTMVEHDAFELEKREAQIEKTIRRSVRVDASSYITQKGLASLGKCTEGQHKYIGEEKYTPFHRTVYNYLHKSGRFKSRQFTDVMGGVGISVFGGLFGASAKAHVVKSVERDSKSLLIYSHFVIHKGMISLVNSRVGTHWQDCTEQSSHYYLRDILTGLDDYLMVQLRFSSEAKRKEIEVKIKVKLLFFSITKTISRVKKSLTSDFELSIYHSKTFPKRQQKKIEFKGTNLEDGIKLVKEYENSRAQFQKAINDASYNSENIHLEYFFVPCSIKPIAEAFTRANDFLLTELIERTTELDSVLEDVKSNEVEINDERKSDLEAFEKEIKFRLSKIGQWKEKSELSHDYVVELLELYGKNRAPYYYERQLRKILNKSQR